MHLWSIFAAPLANEAIRGVDDPATLDLPCILHSSTIFISSHPPSPPLSQLPRLRFLPLDTFANLKDPERKIMGLYI
jgi:hypothetical protein